MLVEIAIAAVTFMFIEISNEPSAAGNVKVAILALAAACAVTLPYAVIVAPENPE